MKKSKWLILTLAATLTVGGFTLIKARAQSNGVLPFGQGRFFARAKQRLNLTDEQAGKIKTTLAADKDKLTTLLASCHEARVHLRTTIQTTNTTDADVRAAAATLAVAQADFAVERAHLFSKISPVLTPEQLQKIDQFEQRLDDFIDGAIVEFGKRLSQ